jgi:ERCC4-type nuclease
VALVNLNALVGPIVVSVPAPTKEEMKRCITTPYVILIDTREQRPWSFGGLFMANEDGTRTPIDIPTRRKGLVTGDYSIDGCVTSFALERKSVADLIGTASWGRERFAKELARMQLLEVSAVIVEGFLPACIEHCKKTKFHPNALVGTIDSWKSKFPKTTWHFTESRYDAMETAWKLADKFYKGSVA